MTLEKIKARREAGEGGFTLIELLVVIIILGILAAVVVFAVGGVGDKGQSAACVIDTRTLRTAAEARFAAQDTYGATPVAFTAPGTATRTPLSEADYVTAGFLSEESEYHNISVYDSDGDAADTTPAIEITVVDDRCGTAGAVVDGGANI